MSDAMTEPEAEPLRIETPTLPHPVVVIGNTGDIMHFSDRYPVTVAEDWIFEVGTYRGADLIDATGAHWRIEAAEIIGEHGAWWARILLALLNSNKLYRLRLTLSPQGRMPIEELIERLCQSYAAHEKSWYDEEVGAGEAGEPQDWAAQCAYATGRLRRATSVTEIYEVLHDPYAGIVPGM